MAIWFDGLFLVSLLVVAPLYVVWRRRTQDTRASRPGPAKYLPTISMAAIMLALLWLTWTTNNRALEDIGLGYPNGKGLIGVVLAGIIVGFGIAMSVMPSKKWSEEFAQLDAEQIAFVPSSIVEWIAYVGFALITGFAWEVLYRGALLYYFTPFMSVPVAMLLAAAVYTLTHGAKSLKAYAGTFVMALAFLAFFVVSENLWGPIILHIAAPLVGGIAMRRLIQKNAEDRTVDG